MEKWQPHLTWRWRRWKIRKESGWHLIEIDVDYISPAVYHIKYRLLRDAKRVCEALDPVMNWNVRAKTLPPGTFTIELAERIFRDRHTFESMMRQMNIGARDQRPT